VKPLKMSMIDSFVKTKSRNVGYKLLRSSGDQLAKNADANMGMGFRIS
jgi:hypothetical protein